MAEDDGIRICKKCHSLYFSKEFDECWDCRMQKQVIEEETEEYDD